MAPYETYSRDFTSAPGVDVSVPPYSDRADRRSVRNLYSSQHQLSHHSSSDIKAHPIAERKQDVSPPGDTYGFARLDAFNSGNSGDYGLGLGGSGGGDGIYFSDAQSNTTIPLFSSLNFNHLHPAPYTLLAPPNSIYSSDKLSSQLSSPPSAITTAITKAVSKHTNFPSTASMLQTHSMLYWGDLEPWMDEEYVKQVCNLMDWSPTAIKIPRPSPEAGVPANQQGNNLGHCFLTFSSHSQANTVLKQLSANPDSSIFMPNSSKPLKMQWASSILPSQLATAFSNDSQQSALPLSQQQLQPNTATQQNQGQSLNGSHQYQKEYSIFVGDLAPETSNSDLVAVFRNPVLGLRNDREPKFIKPFLSCKSAKIMLDQATGVSRGYGFVRFTDEADQQRALIEMHGLYCLSRPMRISPATAKLKPQSSATSNNYPSFSNATRDQRPSHSMPPASHVSQLKSVSTPMATTPAALAHIASTLTSVAQSALGNTPSSSSLGSSSSSATLTNDDNAMLAQLAEQCMTSTNGAGANPDTPNNQMPYNMSEESWKHHAQARAILSNLIGPNGEPLSSSDPYNTTVFVGGLSPLISEETLTTFFAPFGDTHYVKVPVGKHCGFVQFVRKADAEKAIEKMQGFPIGGSRIRLSWGRSQYKAAQAAAQAAQVAALQSTEISSTTPTKALPAVVSSALPGNLTPDQALALLQQFGLDNLLKALGNQASRNVVQSQVSNHGYTNEQHQQQQPPQHQQRNPPDFAHTLPSPVIEEPYAYLSAPPHHSSFSPFSPEVNNYMAMGINHRDSHSFATNGPSTQNTLVSVGFNSAEGRISPPPTTQMPFMAPRYGPYTNQPPPIRPTPISRPTSTSTPSRGSVSDHDEPVLPSEHNNILDLNGTLASLRLDTDHHLGDEKAWKLTSPGTEQQPSYAQLHSIQTMSRTSSP